MLAHVAQPFLATLFLSCIKRYTPCMQRKIFWMLFAALGFVADFTLPFVWAVVAMIPILAVSWWVAYRSHWFSD